MVERKEIDIDHLKRKEVTKGQEKAQLTDEFMTEHMSMIEALSANIIGARKVPPGIEFDDLVSWGVEGLIKAHNNFDPEKGSQFKTYAYYRIRGEIMDKIRYEWKYRNPQDYNEYRKQLREQIADVAENVMEMNDEKATDADIDNNVKNLISNSAVMCLMSLENIDIISESAGTKNPETEFIDESNTELWQEINNLAEDEKRIIELFYVEGLKQKEIADTMKYSRSTVCRMHMKVLEKLKIRLKGKL